MEEMLRGLRQDEMTAAERMAALLKGEPIDRVPFLLFSGLGFCARNVGYSFDSMYNEPEKSFQAQVWTIEQYGFQLEPSHGYASYGAWEFGGEIKFPRGEREQAPSITRFPVESEEDAWKLELPDVTTAGIIPLTMQFCKILEKNGLPIQVSCGSPFTRAANICGVERLCRWMMKKPEVAHHLLRLATDHGIQVAQYWVDTFGAEQVNARDATPVEANQIISPKQFEEFAFPYQKELHEKVLALGIRRFSHCHICGEQNLNLPYLAQIPMGDVGLVSFGAEVDITTAIKYFGDTCIIAGNVSPVVIQTGTPQQVYELSKQCIEKGKYAPRGFMLMAGCDLPPMAPPNNVYMMRKAINDFGWYD